MLKKIILIIFVSFAVPFVLPKQAFPGTARPEEQNPQLERAIWEYKHENYEEALDLLKDLRQTQPDSSMVAYYLGITYKQMQDYSLAEEHLEAAARLQPRIKNAVMELIDLLYKKGETDKAKRWLAVAEKESIFPAQTAFFKGLILMKEGDDIDAIEDSFTRAKTLDPSLANTCDYYLGLAYVKAKKMKEAKRIFQDLTLNAPKTSIAAFADQYLGAISAKEKTSRPFRGNAGMALQYDDNVILMPDNENMIGGVRDQADWRQVYTANGEYAWRPNDTFDTRCGYSFYWGKETDLGFYDTMSHNVYVQPSVYLQKVSLSFPVNYNYICVNDKGYLQMLGGGTQDNLMLGQDHMGQLGLFYRNKQYLWAPSAPGENRDSNEFLGHLAWFYFFAQNKGMAQMKYTINYDDTDEVNWRYIGNRFTIGTAIPLTDRLRWSTTLELFPQYFTETNVIFNKQRMDTTFTAATLVAYEIIKGLELQLNYTFMNNNSNLAIYQYKRSVYSAGLRCEF